VEPAGGSRSSGHNLPDTPGVLSDV